ncbi:uncharacterized protein SRS1_06446 [Sporisorium reilianum f. sp. reilianum]|uniref:Zn(2)-C6 fungal-type domain-containing protein n=1 Tax=Sporisorium reilianum f. sp. reilianum TaxID=72559 RepID=A0A2N8U4V1_9BASI|nr:uncharacterized protein SRS1_06446 [Sporisorium reilianum f. sp. reilianum]
MRISSSPDAIPAALAAASQTEPPSPSTQDSQTAVPPKSEPRQVASIASSSQLTTKRFGDMPRYKVDVDWLDACDNCIQNGKRCRSAAGSTLYMKSCYNCHIRHWTCKIEGERVFKRPPPTAKQLKRKAEYEVRKRTKAKSSEPSSTAKQKAKTPAQPTRKVGKIRLRNNGRFPASQAETAGPTTRKAAKKAAQQAPNTTVEQQETSASGAREGASSSTGAQSLPSDLDDTDLASKGAPNAHVEQYTMGLIKDISAGIKRCQTRMAQFQDFRTGLVILEMALQVLVSDLAKVLTPDNSSLDGSSPAHWILLQLKDYLQGILLVCQTASERPDGKELDEAEKSAKQVGAIVRSETVLDRCLTLISTHVGEEAS